LLLDESNTEAVNGAENDYTDLGTVQYQLPRNVEPRRAFYRSADGLRTISCVCLTQTIYENLPSTTPSIQYSGGGAAQTLTLVRLRPERIKNLPFALDTGQTDGDAT